MAEALEQTSTIFSNGTQGIFAANFVFNLFLSASLQYLWEMVNAQQIIVLLPLFNVQIPQNAQSIFKPLMYVASFDVIPTDMIYSEIFPMEQEPEPIGNENFEALGFETHLIMNSFGSLGFVFFGILPILYILSFCLSLACCSFLKCCRRSSKRLNKQLYWGVLLRMMIESYIIGLISCLLNAKNLDFSREDNWTYLNSVLAFVFLPIFLLFPAISGCFLRSKRESLESDRSLKEKYGELY